MPAVDRALDIVEHLSGQATGLSLSQISVAIGAPKNTVLRILGALTARGYVARDKVDKTFSLTQRFLTLNQPRIGDVRLADAAAGPMHRLRDATRETVQLGIRVADGGVIIDKVEALHPLRISVDVGLRFKLYNNAPGKILLAYMPDEPRERLIKQMNLIPSTPRTLTNHDALRAECARVSVRGYATDHGEADEGIHCVAAPVLDGENRMTATLWVSAPSRRLPPETFAATAEQVVAAAKEISFLLGNSK